MLLREAGPYCTRPVFSFLRIYQTDDLPTAWIGVPNRKNEGSSTETKGHAFARREEGASQIQFQEIGISREHRYFCAEKLLFFDIILDIYYIFCAELLP